MRTDGAMNVVDFGTRKITYNLHRENRKRMRIVISPELTVDVFAPATADEDQIKTAVMKKAAYSLLTRCQPNWRNRKEELDKVVI